MQILRRRRQVESDSLGSPAATQRVPLPVQNRLHLRRNETTWSKPSYWFLTGFEDSGAARPPGPKARGTKMGVPGWVWRQSISAPGGTQAEIPSHAIGSAPVIEAGVDAFVAVAGLIEIQEALSQTPELSIDCALTFNLLVAILRAVSTHSLQSTFPQRRRILQRRSTEGKRWNPLSEAVQPFLVPTQAPS
jgi:hypothetical protein